MRVLVTALTLAALIALAGCGRKGPLYLPDDHSTGQDHQSQSE